MWTSNFCQKCHIFLSKMTYKMSHIGKRGRQRETERREEEEGRKGEMKKGKKEKKKGRER